MKKGLIILFTIAGLLWLSLRIFSRAQHTSIMSNEAAFDIRINPDRLNINTYFDLPDGTFDAQKHVIICKLPVEVDGFKPGYQVVKFGTDGIDCNEAYKPGSYVKYNATELKNEYSKFLLVKNSGMNLSMFDENLGASQILGEQHVLLEYKKGKVNHLVFSLYGVEDFCK
ncbi:MAG: hypothetical protein EOO50_11435 [Flavobacterium sp.]|uniref:hypothetical protein n=1 Tax=Flavobacterium sp. TaxID=239 RepID=UPI001205ACE2|nr:hypothetical protein [Flavobacterium sp.]RZJ66017.1 MAG: hypothetical protein EOO50_11435 [Flavobacterium sp.]